MNQLVTILIGAKSLYISGFKWTMGLIGLTNICTGFIKK